MSIFGSMECRTLNPLCRMQVRGTPQATRKWENCKGVNLLIYF